MYLTQDMSVDRRTQYITAETYEAKPRVSYHSAKTPYQYIRHPAPHPLNPLNVLSPTFLTLLPDTPLSPLILLLILASLMSLLSVSVSSPLHTYPHSSHSTGIQRRNVLLHE